MADLIVESPRLLFRLKDAQNREGLADRIVLFFHISKPIDQNLFKPKEWLPLLLLRDSDSLHYCAFVNPKLELVEPREIFGNKGPKRLAG